MATESWEIGRLRRHPGNYKRHPPEQLLRIQASLREWGQQRPIVARPSDSLVIAGHGVLEAATLLGWATIEVKPWECTDAQAAGYLVADNETQRGSVSDDEALGRLLTTLDAGIKPEAVGLSDTDMHQLLAAIGAADPRSGPAGAGPGAGGPPDPGPRDDASQVPDPGDGRYRSQYGVIVTCDGEAEQERIYGELAALGYACRVVVT